MATKVAKARYWAAVLYPENMRDDWKEVIGDVLGVAGCYCVHDKDSLAKYKPKKSEDYQRKAHVHCILAYNNTTTLNHCLTMVNKLSKDGARCCSTAEQVSSIRNAYEYLIHDTETAKKQGKYQYPKSERITFNNFDIGSYEQISLADKRDMAMEICDAIVNENITNFMYLYKYVRSNFDNEYFNVLKTNSGFFDRLVKGNYLAEQDRKNSEQS